MPNLIFRITTGAFSDFLPFCHMIYKTTSYGEKPQDQLQSNHLLE